MKLRTRLTIGMLAVLLLALGLCSVVTVFAGWQAQVKTAVDYTAGQLQQLQSHFSTASPPVSADAAEPVRRAALRYLFAQCALAGNTGEESVLQDGTEGIYNRSGVNARAVLDSYGRDSERNGSQYSYAVIRLDGRDYCVAGYRFSLFFEDDDRYTVAVVRDVTENMDQVRRAAMLCLLVDAIVILLAAAGGALFLRRALKPLEQLEKSARQIAGGNYGSRIGWKGRDEVAALSGSFDAMAAAVEEHIGRAEARAEEQRLLLAALAHEMRTPVTAITGYAYALQHARLSEEQRREAAGFIDSESRRLERLSTALTQMISTESAPPALAGVDMAGLLQSLEPVLRAKAEKGNVTVHLETEESGELSGSADLLKVLVTNLFDNACKAGATQVTVSWGGGVLAVADNGCGIDPREREKIMRPFYQGDASRNREGFGLGLALCRRIAALHSACLTLESTPGVGTVFRVDFTTLLQVHDASRTGAAVE